MRYILLMTLMACAVDYPETPDAPPNPCTRVEGPQLGQRVTIQVRENPVTFTSWYLKLDGDHQYVGFSMSVRSHFIVKADFNIFYDYGSVWVNPFGDTGTLAKPIDYIDVCEAEVYQPDPQTF